MTEILIHEASTSLTGVVSVIKCRETVGEWEKIRYNWGWWCNQAGQYASWFNFFYVGGLAFCHLKDGRILYCRNWCFVSMVRWQSQVSLHMNEVSKNLHHIQFYSEFRTDLLSCHLLICIWGSTFSCAPICLALCLSALNSTVIFMMSKQQSVSAFSSVLIIPRWPGCIFSPYSVFLPKTP